MPGLGDALALAELAHCVYCTCQDAHETKKTLKVVGQKMLVLEGLLKQIPHSETDNNTQQRPEALTHLDSQIRLAREVVDKAHQMRHAVYLLRAGSICNELQTILDDIQFWINSLQVGKLEGIRQTLEDKWAEQDVAGTRYASEERQENQRLVQALQERDEQVRAARVREIAGEESTAQLLALLEETQQERQALQTRVASLQGSRDAVAKQKAEQEEHYMEQLAMTLQYNLTVSHSSSKTSQSQAHQSLYCPVTMELMQDPCFGDTICHHACERSVWECAIKQKDRKCPVCSARIRSNVISPNAPLRYTVVSYLQGKNQPLESWYCPVTMELMKDPCFGDTICHHTCERSVWEWAIQQKYKKCPLCGTRIRSNVISPNAPLRDTIESYLQENGGSGAPPPPSPQHTPPSGPSAIVDVDALVVRLRICQGNKFLDGIVQIMNNHLSSAPIQQEACSILRVSSTEDPNNKTLIAEAGGIPAVVAALNAHKTVAGVQEQGCWALGNLAYDNPNNQTLIAESSGIHAIVAALNAHEAGASVQEDGCFALANLALDNNNQTLITEASGIPAIVAALNAHKTVVSVQWYGCMALRNIAYRNPNNRTLIAESSGIHAIVAALNAHEGVARVQEYGCAALANLAVDDNNCTLIAEASGIPAIVAALNAHKAVAGVQEEGCLALRNLAANNPNNQKLTFQTGGVAAAQEALQRFLNHAKIQEYGQCVVVWCTPPPAVAHSQRSTICKHN